jgi:signal transduction histidine kinase
LVYAVVTSGLVLGVAAGVFKIDDGTHTAFDTALSETTGFLFLAAGAISHVRRPANPTGLLIALVGVAFFLEDLKLSQTPLVFSIGLLVTSASSALTAHLVVAFPHGVLRSRWERFLVTAAYVAVFGFAFGQVVFSGQGPRGAESVRNVLMIRDEPALAGLFARLLMAVGAVVSLGVVLLLMYRWLAGQLPQRHLLAPVLLIALIGAVTSALGTALASVRPPGPAPALAALLTDVFQISLCLWPLAFLVGVLRSKVGSAEMTRLLVERDEEALANLVAGDEVWKNTHSLETLNAAAVLVRDNQRLTAELEEQLAEVQASRARIVSAGDAERRRFERDLHDGAQQRLVAVVLGLRMAQRRLGSDTDPAISALLSSTVSELVAAVAELRQFAAGIRPPILSEAGPVAAVRTLLERAPIPVDLTADDLPRMDTTTESTAYFVVTEALTNTLKHARANKVLIDFRLEEDRLHVDVTDNGIGGADIDGGSGLRNLRDRVRALGGELTVWCAPGSGTTVSAEMPLSK